MKSLFFTAALLASQVAVAQADRAFQYGLDIVQMNNKSYVLWSERLEAPNTHNIFMSEINLSTNSLGDVNTLVGVPQSQAPVSAAVNSQNKLLVTSTDNRAGINQYYSFYNSSMAEVKPWSQLVANSYGGRTAAVGTNFFVVSSVERLDGAGFGGVALGKNIVLTMVDTNGNIKSSKKITDNGTKSKVYEDNPKIATDGTNTLVLYQRYDENKLYGGQLWGLFIDKNGNPACKPFLIAINLRYETYSVAYNPTIKRFVMAGSAFNSKGWVRTIDLNGKIYDTITGLPEIVRESQLISSGNRIAYVAYQNLVVFLKVTSKDLKYVGKEQAQANWSEAGTDGLFKPDGNLLIMTMDGDAGVTMVPFSVPTALARLLAP